jgi:hypothetical protein
MYLETAVEKVFSRESLRLSLSPRRVLQKEIDLTTVERESYRHGGQ